MGTTPEPSDAAVAEFLEALRVEFPRFSIRHKAGDRLSRWIDRALRLVTFGGQRHYLTRYHTVLGDTLYVPPSWVTLCAAEKLILLRHERVHLRQRRRYGTLGMSFIYLFPWFPIGLAYGRARIEWEAYVETLRATAELRGLEAARDAGLREHIVRRFVGPDYGWMWPFRRTIERWYALALERLSDHEPGEP